ncbi:MAG: hypothetical protein RLZZ440_1984 [Planctomycetota bacterium]|jgi:hypothetical protein
MSNQTNHDVSASGSAAAATFSRAVLACVWLALVAIAVAGRAWQPAAHVTPLAGVSLVAGFLFPNIFVAASVPLVAIAIGNLFLPSYGSLTLAIVVYAALAWPVVLGRLGILGRPGERPRWLAITGGALASSLIFFFATNTAHWALTEQYPHTPAGLLACLVAGLPFHRWMPVGDVAWSLALFGLVSLAVTAGNGLATPRLAAAELPRGRNDAAA